MPFVRSTDVSQRYGRATRRLKSGALHPASSVSLAVFESLAVRAGEVLVYTGLTVLGEKLDLARSTEEIPTCVSEPRCLARGGVHDCVSLENLRKVAEVDFTDAGNGISLSGRPKTTSIIFGNRV
jgi:hypothetical protein